MTISEFKEFFRKVDILWNWRRNFRVNGGTFVNSESSATLTIPKQQAPPAQAAQGGDTPPPVVPIFQGQVLGAPADNTLAAMWPEWSDPS